MKLLTRRRTLEEEEELTFQVSDVCFFSMIQLKIQVDVTFALSLTFCFSHKGNVTPGGNPLDQSQPGFPGTEFFFVDLILLTHLHPG
jgi:hypothetical protein